MLKIRNFITLYVITILYFVRALQTKFPSGMLPVGIEPTGMILHNIDKTHNAFLKTSHSQEANERNFSQLDKEN